MSALCSSCMDAQETGIEDASSEGGYTTPRSLETPVATGGSKCSSLNQIRDPYATRLRHSASIDERLQRYHPGSQRGGRAAAANAANAANSSKSAAPPPSRALPENNTESIYTILIRFPSKHEQQQQLQQQQHHQHQPREHAVAKRVPSIQMLAEEDGAAADAKSNGGNRNYPRSLPIVRRFEGQHQGSVDSSNGKRNSGSGYRSANPSVPCSPSLRQLNQKLLSKDDTSVVPKLPLDAKLVPKQLLRAASTSCSSSAQQAAAGAGQLPPAGTSIASHTASLLSVASSGLKRPTMAAGAGAPVKPKKASSEKKQDRKAAKTLSAILLAFIVTWTPYSVLVVINAFLGKESADRFIPSYLWDFSYYLCYINSTINPVLYALCNAAFRRTYIRILTCRWGSRARQPINRYYYG